MRNIRAKLATTAAIGGAAIGGAAIASAATSSAPASSPSPTPTTTTQGPTDKFPAHGTARHEDAEKIVTGTAANKARAAAVKAVGGGTAGDVTTDYTQDGYEVTVTKSDGSKTEIHLDKSFNVVQGHRGGHPGNCDHGNDSSSGSTDTTTPY